MQALVSDTKPRSKFLLSFHDMSLSFRFSVCEIGTRTVNLCRGVVKANGLLKYWPLLISNTWLLCHLRWRPWHIIGWLGLDSSVLLHPEPCFPSPPHNALLLLLSTPWTTAITSEEWEEVRGRNEDWSLDPGMKSWAQHRKEGWGGRGGKICVCLVHYYHTYIHNVSPSMVCK